MRRSIRILDMEYKPAEIAVAAGAPARKDANGRYWIHGLTFVQWLKDAGPKKPGDKSTIENDEAYCFNCRRVVHFTETRRIKRTVYGICLNGHKVIRYISLKSS
jgi:hypothetical protein